MSALDKIVRLHAQGKHDQSEHGGWSSEEPEENKVSGDEHSVSPGVVNNRRLAITKTSKKLLPRTHKWYIGEGRYFAHIEQGYIEKKGKQYSAYKSHGELVYSTPSMREMRDMLGYMFDARTRKSLDER